MFPLFGGRGLDRLDQVRVLMVQAGERRLEGCKGPYSAGVLHGWDRLIRDAGQSSRKGASDEKADPAHGTHA
jgi:hypothetical protein